MKPCFEDAFQETLAVEGGYVNDPDDTGGETYKGIARKFHPDWPGWEIIDAAKDESGDMHIPASLAQSRALQSEVQAFYQTKFWDALGLDSVMSQSVAEELFDTAVNAGKGRAVRFLQEALNLLSDVGLAVDGEIGPRTLGALQDYLVSASYAEAVLVKTLNGLQFGHYWKLAKSKPRYRKFLAGWINKRVKFKEA